MPRHCGRRKLNLYHSRRIRAFQRLAAAAAAPEPAIQEYCQRGVAGTGKAAHRNARTLHAEYSLSARKHRAVAAKRAQNLRACRPVQR